MTRIKKIIIVTAALLFVFSGVSFAHDWNYRKHKPHGKAYGHHYKAHKHHPGWKYKHVKRDPHYGKRYAHKEAHNHYYYEKYRRQPAPREDVIYKVAMKDPDLIFKIIVKDHR
jgi:hypothetical protein